MMKHENGIRVKHLNIAMILAVLSFSCAGVHGQGYPDGRPSATLRLEAKDQGVILKHGDGPGQCDVLGAREALIFEEKGVYHLFYDGAGAKGWLARSWPGRLLKYQSLHTEVADATASLVKGVQRRSGRVFVYTVNQEEQMQNLFALGVDGIFTDDPLLAQTALKKFRRRTGDSQREISR